jgi:hypothetical protein
MSVDLGVVREKHIGTRVVDDAVSDSNLVECQTNQSKNLEICSSLSKEIVSINVCENVCSTLLSKNVCSTKLSLNIAQTNLLCLKYSFPFYE